MYKSFIQKYEAVAEETKEKTGKEYGTWLQHIELIVSLIGVIVLKDKQASQPSKIKNSLLNSRVAELLEQIPWIWTCINYGAYHQAIRELRYILESSLKAFYLDEGHPDANLACKLEILKEIEDSLYGRRLINRLTLDHQKTLRILYGELSKYVHFSYEELKPYIVKGDLKPRPTFEFQRTHFNLCRNLMNRTLDAVYFLLLNRFPDTKDYFKKMTELKNSLDEVQCKLTLKYLKS